MYLYKVPGSIEPVGRRSLVVRQQNSTLGGDGSLQSNGTQSGVPGDTSPGLSVYAIVIIAVVIIVVLIGTLLTTYSSLRRARLQGKQPKYIPGKYLKKRWNTWKPRGKYASLDDEQDSNSFNAPTGQVRQPASSVDRHTSVRSIISLPAYSRTPKEHEEVIAREGERGGMDTVIEFPETVEEEEGRREEEMESLYQIRQARRQEIAEREERRRQRREAREAGDFARLNELRQESRQRRDQNASISANQSTTTLTAESLIAEHNARGRDRRVSSVSYAALGLARHDGSRIRANSKGSEHGGLLASAAPMGSVPPLPHSRNGSDGTSLLSLHETSGGRYRDRSNSGAVSVSSLGSSFDNISSREARPTTADTTTESQHTTQSVSDSGSDEVDIVDERVEPARVTPGASPLPPQYEAIDWGDAPEYTEEERIARMSRILSVHDQMTVSNAVSQNEVSSNEVSSRIPSMPPRLPSLHITPTINIEGPTSIPNTPIVRHQQ